MVFYQSWQIASINDDLSSQRESLWEYQKRIESLEYDLLKKTTENSDSISSLDSRVMDLEDKSNLIDIRTKNIWNTAFELQNRLNNQ